MTTKRIAIAATVLSMGLGLAASARADVDLFDTNQTQIDSSVAMRRSTTEQDNPIRGQSVLERPRPDFDPVPVPVGSFQLFPALNLGAAYNSNIFAVPNSPIDDTIWKVNPTATLASNWGRNAVVLSGLGDFNYYTNNTQQNSYAGALQAEGRYDIADQTWVAGVVGYQRVTEPRGGLDTPGNSVGPSQFDLYSDGVSAYRGVAKVKGSLEFDQKWYNYSSLNLIGGGINNQDIRDRVENNAGTEVDYEVTQNFVPYIHGGYNWRNYTAGGINSSHGFQTDIGAKMDFGGVTTANFYAGYLQQDYYNYVNGTVGALDYGADILWNVTTLTSIEGKVGRSIQETETTGQQSALTTQASLQASHELQRNIVLQASMTYDNFDFQGAARHDNMYDAGTGVRYYINRHVYSDLTYDYQHRNSTASGNDFDDNVGFVRIGLQY